MTTDVLPVVIPADHVSGPPQGHWTYAAYAALPDDGHRYEILNGVLYIAPAATTDHQGAAARFVYHLLSAVEFSGHGRVLPAPIDVELAPDQIVQPDVIVVLKDSAGIITGSRVIGAPDLVIEIASPSTAGYDRREKQNAYAAAGVREYWIADPAARTVEILVLEDGVYRSLNVFRGQAMLPSQIVPWVSVVVDQFFV